MNTKIYHNVCGSAACMQPMKLAVLFLLSVAQGEIGCITEHSFYPSTFYHLLQNIYRAAQSRD